MVERVKRVKSGIAKMVKIVKRVKCGRVKCGRVKCVKRVKSGRVKSVKSGGESKERKERWRE